MDVTPNTPNTPVEPAPERKPHGGGERMVRVGKWSAKPSKEAARVVTVFLTEYFRTEKVWTRKEHGAFVVAVRESAKNTELVEEFRFNREMDQRFKFTETNGQVEVELKPV